MSVYKIVLDSNDTNSYVGSQFNATYTLNMNELVNNVKDLDKRYLLSFQMTSIANYGSVSGFSRDNVYGVNIHFGKNVDIYRYSSTKQVFSGLLNFDYDYSSYSSVTAGASSAYSTPMFISTKPNDNDVVLLDNLKMINYAHLNIVNTSNDTILTVGDETKSRYVCILTLKEVI